jgi:hypothetical protein
LILIFKDYINDRSKSRIVHDRGKGIREILKYGKNNSYIEE